MNDPQRAKRHVLLLRQKPSFLMETDKKGRKKHVLFRMIKRGPFFLLVSEKSLKQDARFEAIQQKVTIFHFSFLVPRLSLFLPMAFKLFKSWVCNS